MSVTGPQGFRAAGVAAGLKTSGATDLALVVNDGPDRHGAALFTSNRVEAAPVTWSRQVVSDGRVDAVVLNSGGANACTGPAGFQDTHATAERVAELLQRKRALADAVLGGTDAALTELSDYELRDLVTLLREDARREGRSST